MFCREKSETNSNANFTYDGNNQLINATHPESVTSVFAYDPLGNRVTDQGGVYVYDNKKQRLGEDWQYRYVYDNNGNLTSKILKSDPTKITSYSYNSSNQLILLKELDGSLEVKESRYFYDANGRRIVKDHRDHVATSNSFVRKFVYDGEDILFEMNDQNDLLASYTHSKIRSDDVLSMDRMGVSYFYLKDHLGSVHEILNSSGNLVQKYVYSAFGKILKTEDSSGQALSTPTVENFYTFTGRESDFETGLNYYRARYYDPGLGRFLTEDPHSGELINPLTFLSRYIYVVNNPIMNLDPTGKDVVPPKLGDIQNAFRMIAVLSPAPYLMPFFQSGDYISNVFKNIDESGDFSGIASSSTYNESPAPIKYATLGVYVIINFKVLEKRIERFFKKIF